MAASLRRARIGAWSVLLLATAFARGPALADAAKAAALVAEGRAALERGSTDQAIAKLRAATVEDEGSVEAWSWLGQALEKKGDSGEAVEAFRKTAALVATRGAAEPLGPEAREAARKASARLEALVPGEAEIGRLGVRYVSELLALARQSLEKDPATARRAVDAALGAAPADEGALALAERLGLSKGADGGDQGDAPGVETWDDWIERKAIDSGQATYEGGSLIYDVEEKGEIAWADPPIEPKDRLVLEMEMRCLERHAVSAHAGWAFYGTDGHFVAAFVADDEVVLFHGAGEDQRELARAPAKKPGEKAWRRLKVVVEDKRRVAVTVDGKTVLRHEIPDDVRPEGQVGIWTQRARVEYRKLRVGTR